jgi:hypothetical protein
LKELTSLTQEKLMGPSNSCAFRWRLNRNAPCSTGPSLVGVILTVQTENWACSRTERVVVLTNDWLWALLCVWWSSVILSRGMEGAGEGVAPFSSIVTKCGIVGGCGQDPKKSALSRCVFYGRPHFAPHYVAIAALRPRTTHHNAVISITACFVSAS